MEGEKVLSHEAGADGVAASELLESLLVPLAVLVGFGGADETPPDELGELGGMPIVAAGHEGVHAGLEAIIAECVEYGFDKDAFAVLSGAEEKEELVFPHAAGQSVSAEGLQEFFHLGIAAGPLVQTVLPAAGGFISGTAGKGLGDHVCAAELGSSLTELPGLEVNHAVRRAAQQGLTSHSSPRRASVESEAARDMAP